MSIAGVEFPPVAIRALPDLRLGMVSGRLGVQVPQTSPLLETTGSPGCARGFLSLFIMYRRVRNQAASTALVSWSAHDAGLDTDRFGAFWSFPPPGSLRMRSLRPHGWARRRAATQIATQLDNTGRHSMG
jgi:hypothetical protein